jgi:hypothetical protein
MEVHVPNVTDSLIGAAFLRYQCCRVQLIVGKDITVQQLSILR